MIELVGCSADKIYHRDVNIFMFVVPLEAHATMGVAGPGGGTIVVSPDSSNEVLCVPFLEIFHTEIIHTEGKCCFYLCFQSPGVCCSST